MELRALLPSFDNHHQAIARNGGLFSFEHQRHKETASRRRHGGGGGGGGKERDARENKSRERVTREKSSRERK